MDPLAEFITELTLIHKDEMAEDMTCPECDGDGAIPCPSCDGRGTVESEEVESNG